MKKLMMATAISLAMLATSTVWADDHDRDHGGPGQVQHDNHPGRWADDNGPHTFPAPAPYHHPRGYQAGHQWQAGDRLPASHRNKRYYVDYRQYNLQAPPPGHQWVRVDNDFVLTAIATGVVVDVLHNVLQ